MMWLNLFTAFIVGAEVGYLVNDYFFYRPTRKDLQRCMELADECMAEWNKTIVLLKEVEKMVPTKSPIQMRKL